MKDYTIKKGKSTFKLMIIALVILLLCLGVCIYEVSILERTYSKQISESFQEYHTVAGNVLDDKMEACFEIMNTLDERLNKESDNLPEDVIKNVLGLYAKINESSEIAVLTLDEDVFYGGKKSTMQETENIFQWEKSWTRFTTQKGNKFVTPIVQKIDDKFNNAVLFEKPFFYRRKNMGYIVATLNVDEIFSAEAFAHLDEQGDLYLISKDGEILSRSEDNYLVKDERTDFFESVMEYSDGSEMSRKGILSVKDAMNYHTNTFQNFTTSTGTSVMISLYSSQVMDDIYFIACYRDNLVGDKVQPLVYKYVLSSILIIVLMIAIIVYVWASAKKANLTIERLAYIDYVTKGKNINFFKEFIAYTVNIYKETPFDIYRYDIANFRYINEAYGHTKADSLLSACISCFEDVFSDKELCVRMNADQFLAVVVNDKDVELNFAKYTSKVNEYARGIGIKYTIKFKVGICKLQKHEGDVDIIIDHANAARKTLNMDDNKYFAKYSDKIVTDMRKIDRIESEQQHALAAEEFKVYLQPKWDIVDNCIAGAEALVRWVRSDGSMVYPDEFIPVFENNGFVEKLDLYMLDKVCEKMHELYTEHRMIFPVSVNQSRLLLHSTGYVENVQKILTKYEIDPRFIELEITESVFENERSNMIETMKRLKKLGIKLSMDDFGSGYSSLNMLKDVPFDIIKIDREFFSESVTSTNSLLILQKIIEMVNGIGMEVICEGVENGEQSLLLRDMGCRRVQGYYYSKPIPCEDYCELYCYRLG